MFLNSWFREALAMPHSGGVALRTYLASSP